MSVDPRTMTRPVKFVSGTSADSMLTALLLLLLLRARLLRPLRRLLLRPLRRLLSRLLRLLLRLLLRRWRPLLCLLLLLLRLWLLLLRLWLLGARRSSKGASRASPSSHTEGRLPTGCLFSRTLYSGAPWACPSAPQPSLGEPLL
jgi:hypothetical protein